MAYVKKSKTGRSWEVHHGRSGAFLTKFQKRKNAKKRVRQLHKKFRPKRRNRGRRAKRRLM